MLVKYKKDHQKIAMGLLSFMQSEHDLTTLRRTIQTYEENPEWQLYLWKQGEDFIAAIGIKKHESSFNVHHLAVNPSYRNQGIGYLMVQEVQKLQDPLTIAPTFETKEFLENYWEKHPT